MNTQKTPLVQKLSLVMLVLIFGCLVLMLMYGRKQIESLREGPPVSASSNSTSNDDASIRRAYPSMRSSKTPPLAKVVEPEGAKSAPPAAPAPATVETPIAAEQPATVLPVATATETPEGLSAEPGMSGRVFLTGTPPAETPIRFDATCGSFHPRRATTTRYVVSRDGGLANVFVYISKGAEKLKVQPEVAPILLEQKDCMYQPYVLGAMVNQPIQIKNSDPILHNVHALPKRGDEFNFAQPLQGQVDEHSFSKPELFIKIKCDVHDWMLSYVSVLSHPFFAVTDTNGFFQLPSGLPPGKYEITSAHLKAGTASQTILLKNNNNVRLDFRLPVTGKPWTALTAP